MTGQTNPDNTSRPALRDGERRYFLNPSGPTVLGRQSSAILLQGAGVAAQHARVVPSREGFLLESLEGEVLVNGTPLLAPALLRPNDIVRIDATSLIFEGPASGDGGPQACNPDEIFRRAKDSVAAIRRGKDLGSGFFLAGGRLLVTNRHVVGYEREVTVHLSSGVPLPGRVVRSFPEVDLAFVRVEGADVKGLPLAAPGSIRVGEPALAIGHPHGLSHSLTRGIVSAIDREIRGSVYLQTDAAINPGSSGGPLLNDFVEVIGVATLGLAGQGLGFAIPANVVRQRLARLEADEALLKKGHGVYCPVCGLLSLGGVYCQGCGISLGGVAGAQTPVTQTSCTRCGRQLGPGDRFCPSCGLVV